MNNIFNKFIFLPAAVIFSSACSTNGNDENSDSAASAEPEMEVVETKFQNSGKYAAIKDMQILDPSAPATNAGIVNSLNGDVGKEAMDNYRKSTYEPKQGRVRSASTSGTSSGSNSSSGTRN